MNHKKTKHYSAMKIGSLVVVLSLALALVAQGQTIIWTAANNPHVVSGSLYNSSWTNTRDGGGGDRQHAGKQYASSRRPTHRQWHGRQSRQDYRCAGRSKRQWMFAAHRI